MSKNKSCLRRYAMFSNGFLGDPSSGIAQIIVFQKLFDTIIKEKRLGIMN